MQQAAHADAPARVVADARTILREYGGDDSADAIANWHTRSVDAQRDVHEQFARAFERYLMENKAPTPELRSAFQQFSQWLTDIYKTVLSLHVELSDEVRGVMDRLVATEAEIAAAQTRRGFDLPTDVPAGVDATAWRAAHDLSDKAGRAAQSTLQTRALRDMQWLDLGAEGAKGRSLRRLQSRVADLHRQARAAAESEVAAEPVNKARAYLSGEARLDLDAVRGVVPEAAVTRLGGMATEGGLHPDIAAALLAYDSGEALIVFQKGNGTAQQALVLEGQEILRSVGIDPIDGPENLVWAPMRVQEQHAAAALEAVVTDLRAAHEMGLGRETMVKILQKHGQAAERRKQNDN